MVRSWFGSNTGNDEGASPPATVMSDSVPLSLRRFIEEHAHEHASRAASNSGPTSWLRSRAIRLGKDLVLALIVAVLAKLCMHDEMLTDAYIQATFSVLIIVANV